jgi:hypothetical protein
MGNLSDAIGHRGQRAGLRAVPGELAGRGALHLNLNVNLRRPLRVIHPSTFRSALFSYLEENNMKSILSLAVAGMFVLSSSAFAGSPQATPAPAATTAAPATPVVKETRAEKKAEKKQIEADEKMAMAECKKLKGAEKKACKKDAEAKEKAAMAELKKK